MGYPQLTPREIVSLSDLPSPQSYALYAPLKWMLN